MRSACKLFLSLTALTLMLSMQGTGAQAATPDVPVHTHDVAFLKRLQGSPDVTPLALFSPENDEYRNRHPNRFKAARQIDMQMLESLQRQFLVSGTPETLEVLRAYSPYLVPIAQRFSAALSNVTARDGKHQEILQHFTNKLDTALATQEVTPLLIFMLPLMYTFAISDPGQEETDFYKVLTGNDYYGKMFGGERREKIWQDELLFMTYVSKLIKHVEHYTSVGTDEGPRLDTFKANKLIDKELKNHMPATMPYYVTDVDFFSLAELTYLNLDDIAPVSLRMANDPHRPLKVHGIRSAHGVSPFGHALHDLLHSDQLSHLSKIVTEYIRPLA